MTQGTTQGESPRLELQFYKDKHGTPVVKVLWDGDVEKLFELNGFCESQAHIILHRHFDSSRTPKYVNRTLRKMIKYLAKGLESIEREES